MKIILAIYNFIVGDMIILIGVLLTIGILALINLIAPGVQQVIGGAILIIAILAVLTATLTREARAKR